jgi:hypothetical protein
MSNVTVTLYIYETNPEFAKQASRYIVQAHREDTRSSKWTGVESLVELHYQLVNFVPKLSWDTIEIEIAENGGFKGGNLDMSSNDFERLFQQWIEVH